MKGIKDIENMTWSILYIREIKNSYGIEKSKISSARIEFSVFNAV